MLKKFLQKLSEDRSKYILLIIGTIAWSLTMVKSGLNYAFGVGFWGPNAHDGIWHIALARGLSQGTWEIPIFAGGVIKNYHLGFDLFISILHKITFLPLSTLYFQILPPIFAFLVGLTAYNFIFNFRNSKREAFWGVCFVYFGGSFGYVINLVRNGTIDGESLFWAQQSISTLINPPFALSLIFIFSGLSILLKGVRQRNSKFLILSTFLFGLLVLIKVYAGILVLAGLFVSGIFLIYKERDFNVFKVFAGSLILSVLFFSPTESDPGKTIIWKPFWFLEEMMSTKDRLYWPKYAEAMINYKLGGVLLKGIAAYFFAFILFILGNLGTRILFFILLLQKGTKLSRYSFIEVLIIVVIMAGIAAPLFFVQTGTPWNTIQFMYYSLTFAGVISGIYIGSLMPQKGMSGRKFTQYALLLVLIVILTIPTSIGTLAYHYLPYRAPSRILKEEVAALKYLESKPEGIVLTQAFDRKNESEIYNDPPIPIYLYETTAYVSAYSGKKTYLEDQVNLEITGYNWEERREKVMKYFTQGNFDSNEFLSENNIKYVYVVKELQNLYKKVLPTENLNKIFENSEITIFEVQ